MKMYHDMSTKIFSRSWPLFSKPQFFIDPQKTSKTGQKWALFLRGQPKVPILNGPGCRKKGGSDPLFIGGIANFGGTPIKKPRLNGPGCSFFNPTPKTLKIDRFLTFFDRFLTFFGPFFDVFWTVFKIYNVINKSSTSSYFLKNARNKKMEKKIYSSSPNQKTDLRLVWHTSSRSWKNDGGQNDQKRSFCDVNRVHSLNFFLKRTTQRGFMPRFIL